MCLDESRKGYKRTGYHTANIRKACEAAKRTEVAVHLAESLSDCRERLSECRAYLLGVPHEDAEVLTCVCYECSELAFLKACVDTGDHLRCGLNDPAETRREFIEDGDAKTFHGTAEDGHITF